MRRIASISRDLFLRTAALLSGMLVATAVAARCYAGEKNLAYGPFVEGLSAALGREGGGHLEDLPAASLQEVSRLLPDLSPDSPPAPLDTPEWRTDGCAQ